MFVQYFIYQFIGFFVFFARNMMEFYPLEFFWQIPRFNKNSGQKCQPRRKFVIKTPVVSKTIWMLIFQKTVIKEVIKPVVRIKTNKSKNISLPKLLARTKEIKEQTRKIVMIGRRSSFLGKSHLLTQPKRKATWR